MPALSEDGAGTLEPAARDKRAMLKGSLMIINYHLPFKVPVGRFHDYLDTTTFEPLTKLFAGDGPHPQFLSNPCVIIFQCDSCHARFMGTPILTTPTCPNCLGTVHQIVTWDTRYQAWPQRHEGGE